MNSPYAVAWICMLEAQKSCIHTFDNEIRSQNTHGGNTNTRLGCSIGGAEAGEDNS
jgi:hypothetical protein